MKKNKEESTDYEIPSLNIPQIEGPGRVFLASNKKDSGEKSAHLIFIFYVNLFCSFNLEVVFFLI